MDIAIIGKGALGLLFGNMAQEHLGADHIRFVMDDDRYQRRKDDTYTINGEEVSLTDIPVSQAEPVDVVLVATKSTGLSSALDLVEPLLGEDTVILPLLNGITSEEKVAQRYGWERTVGCVSIGMDAARFGTRLQYSMPGQLVLGRYNEATPQDAVDRAVAALSAAGIPHSVDSNVKRRLWAKFMANVGANQVCSVFQINYRQLFADQTSEAFRTYMGAMREVLAVSIPEGVNLTEDDINAYIEVLKSLDPESIPSTAQDRVNKNLSEVDEFSGEVIRLGAKHGILVPCNQFFYDSIRAYEAQY